MVYQSCTVDFYNTRHRTIGYNLAALERVRCVLSALACMKKLVWHKTGITYAPINIL